MLIYRIIAKFIGVFFQRPKASDFNEKPKAKRVWFHAASAGELESCTEIIIQAYLKGYEVYVSAFSLSAKKECERLKERLGHFKLSHDFWVGMSPFEGSWLGVFQKVKPSVLISVKYEAWPDLWASASRCQIPLLIIDAKPRSSLTWIKRLSYLLCFQIPTLTLSSSEPQTLASLQVQFPKARMLKFSDPRWDRVAYRLSQRSSAFEEFYKSIESLPKPWVVFGSVWPEDMELWGSFFEKIKGTVFLFPHEKMEETLSSHHIKWVSQRGVLAEFYQYVSWAYVGGGFNKGVHSTIEPGVHGIPICIGPKNAEYFSEIKLMNHSGQLTVIHGANEIPRFLESLSESLANVSQWKSLNTEHQGGVDQVLSWLEKQE